LVPGTRPVGALNFQHCKDMYLFLIAKNISFYFIKAKQKYFLWLF